MGTAYRSHRKPDFEGTEWEGRVEPTKWKQLQILFSWDPKSLQMVTVQFSRSVMSHSLQPHELQYARPPVHCQLPEFTQTYVHRVGDAIQLSHPLSSPSPPALNLSQHQGVSNESALHIRWPKYWSLSFSISPSNEYSGLFSFSIDWLDLLTVQGTLKSLL